MSLLKVLLTNDDGINAQGLKELYNFCKKKYQTYIVAPDGERSGKSHAITLYHPIFYREIEDNIYVVEGTPADCVKIALSEIFTDVNFVISGINLGYNLGPNIFYSSTVSQCLEAFLYGKSAIALSLQNSGEPKFATVIRVLDKLLCYISENKISNFCLSINVPNVDYKDLKGVVVTAHAVPIIKDNFAKGLSPKNLRYVWVKNDPILDEKRVKLLIKNTDFTLDIEAVNAGNASITPLKPVLFDDERARELKNFRI